jgi:manganese oxidase
VTGEPVVPDFTALSNATSRRDFLRKSAVAAAAGLPAVATLSACSDSKAAPRPDSLATGPVAAPAAPALTASQKADAMDAMHERGVKAFPAKTEGKGNQILPPRLVSGVKVYELTAEEVEWEVEPGRKVKAWAYNRQVPGPQIRVREGDRVRVILTNRLSQSTAVHFHGLELPNDQDGVPFITQPPVKPGESYT